MKAFAPAIEIRLIKTARRGLLAAGLPAAQRYQELGAIDLTPYLLDGHAVHVQQFVGGGAGNWGFTLGDRMMPEFKESLYALIEPMDMIEIRMARLPHAYQGRSDGNQYKLPVVTRGFVTNVSRTRSMQDGKPLRIIQVTGHDFGKVLEILRIYYLNNSAIGDNLIGELKFFHKYAGLGSSKIMSGNDFVRIVVDVLINPFIARLTTGADGAKVGAAVIRQVVADADIDGTVSPQAVANFTDGSTLQFLSRFLDIGAFNEMFLDDRDDAVALVVRRNPFLDLSGGHIQQGAKIEVIDLDDAHIESITEGRSDAGVANYYWVTNSGWQIIDNMPMRELAAASPPGDYATFEYENTAAARYGFRKMEVEARMGPNDQAYSDAAAQGDAMAETDRRMKWLVDRRRVLAAQNKDNVVLEHGQMRVMGNERIKRGMYMRVSCGDFPALYYATSVYHQFVPFHSFTSIVNFERGTAFAERARRPQAPYLAETSLKGAR